MKNNEIKNETDEIRKWRGKVQRGNLKYEAVKYKFDFQQHETIRSCDESIYAGKLIQTKLRWVKPMY